MNYTRYGKEEDSRKDRVDEALGKICVYNILNMHSSKDVKNIALFEEGNSSVIINIARAQGCNPFNPVYELKTESRVFRRLGQKETLGTAQAQDTVKVTNSLLGPKDRVQCVETLANKIYDLEDSVNLPNGETIKVAYRSNTWTIYVVGKQMYVQKRYTKEHKIQKVRFYESAEMRMYGAVKLDMSFEMPDDVVNKILKLRHEL